MTKSNINKKTGIKLKIEKKGIIPLLDGRYLYLVDYNQLIPAEMKEYYLKYGNGREIKVHEAEIDEELIRRKVRRLPSMAIEMTENCNLKCKYCIFSGHYENWRTLDNRDMESETACQGLDYVFSLIKNRRKKVFALGFYGGEPLLKFKTLKKIVKYAKHLFIEKNKWDLRFNITSNLTLLDDEILDYLVENKFILLVSLDGNKENHDSKRVYSNGHGTFDTIYMNLERMALRYPDYFAKVGFSAVFSPDLSLKKTYDFFCNCDLVKNNRVRFTLVNPGEGSYYQTYNFNWKKYREDYNLLYQQIFKKIKQKEDLSKYEEMMYSNLRRTAENLDTTGITSIAGACLYDSRLFLDTRGRFHVCERVNSTMSLGDVKQGFNFSKMVNMVKKFAEFNRTHCLDCSVRFLCSRCYAQFAGDQKFEPKPKFCRAQHATLIRNLESYISYKEEGLI